MAREQTDTLTLWMKGLIGLAAFRTPFIPWYIRDRDQDRDRGVRGFGFVMVHVMEGVLWTFRDWITGV